MTPDAVTTFESIDGYRVVRSCGRAIGRATRPRNLIKSTFRSLGAFIGLAPMEFLTDAERARAESLAELLLEAERLGANGVVGLRFEASEGPDGATRVIAFGEAVLLDPPPATAVNPA